MAELTVKVYPPTRYDERGYIVYDTKESENSDEEDEEKPEIAFEAARHTCFDILIFFPPRMPPFRRDKSGKLLPIDDGERVVPNWIRMRLDREVTFAVALSTLGTAYWPPPDDKLKEVEDEYLRIRDRWNAQVPRNTVPSTNLRVKPLPRSGTARSETDPTDTDNDIDTGSDSDNDTDTGDDTGSSGNSDDDDADTVQDDQ
ncbi:hypothetical protein C8Q73DRAFT_203952 [Cubamyces lactineus]|nr:hypothetical protein C8Q73DRAFT_203952 [Cubamyces lactineus]